MWAPKLEFAWRTDQGRVRAHNEDAVAVHADWGLVVVADGVGGASAGEVASRLAVETIAACFARQTLPRGDRDQACLLAESAVGEANLAVWERAQETPGCAGMGTTVVMGFAGSDWLAFANVGDSRLYRLRAGGWSSSPTTTPSSRRWWIRGSSAPARTLAVTASGITS
jgi:PPM family protein phosphatase